MGFWSVLSCAHKWIEERTSIGDVAVDATVGNGVDTLFLCQTVGPSGTVYGFDIQEQALEQARKRIAARWPNAGGPRLQLFLRSHAEMLQAIPASDAGRVSAVMFNLGYLPGADTSVITRPDTTLPALESALKLLKTGGIVTVVLYPGHEGGREEADAVEAWAESLPPDRYQVLSYKFLNARNNPPYLIAIEKKKHLQKTR